jgi:hypothetical protein
MNACCELPTCKIAVLSFPHQSFSLLVFPSEFNLAYLPIERFVNAHLLESRTRNPMQKKADIKSAKRSRWL